MLQKLAKQRVDSMAIYKEQGRDDLFEVEASELDVIQEFLPEPMDEDSLKELVKKVVVAEGASSLKDMGKVIKEVTKQAEGRADGKRIAQEVKSIAVILDLIFLGVLALFALYGFKKGSIRHRFWYRIVFGIYHDFVYCFIVNG